MLSLHSQFILLVPSVFNKSDYLGPRKNVVQQTFLVYEKLVKMHKDPHALDPVQSQVMLTFTVAGRRRATASSFKLAESKASGGVNYKLYGLLHFINVTSGI